MITPGVPGPHGRSRIVLAAQRLLRLAGAMAVLGLLFARPSAAQDRADADPARADRARVGPLGDGRIVVPTNQVLSPAGRQVGFRGRPTDVVLHPGGRYLAVLNTRSNEVLTIDVERGAIVDRAAIPGGSYAGIVFSPEGRHLYASTLRVGLIHLEVGDDGTLTPAPAIEGLGRLPIGLAWDQRESGSTLPRTWTTPWQRSTRPAGSWCGPSRSAMPRTAWQSSGRRPTSATSPARSPPRGTRPGRRAAGSPSGSTRCATSPPRGPSRSSTWRPARSSRRSRSGCTPRGSPPHPTAGMSASPTPTATRSRSSTRSATRSSRRSRPARTTGSSSAAPRTPWPSTPTAGRLYVSNGTNNAVAVLAFATPAR